MPRECLPKYCVIDLHKLFDNGKNALATVYCLQIRYPLTQLSVKVLFDGISFFFLFFFFVFVLCSSYDESALATVRFEKVARIALDGRNLYKWLILNHSYFS